MNGFFQLSFTLGASPPSAQRKLPARLHAAGGRPRPLVSAHFHAAPSACMNVCRQRPPVAAPATPPKGARPAWRFGGSSTQPCCSISTSSNHPSKGRSRCAAKSSARITSSESPALDWSPSTCGRLFESGVGLGQAGTAPHHLRFRLCNAGRLRSAPARKAKARISRRR